MVFNLDPLDITLDFERRKYRLGETIAATVTLIPNKRHRNPNCVPQPHGAGTSH